MRRQVFLALGTSLALGVCAFACNEPDVTEPSFSPTGLGTGSPTGTSAGTGTATGAGAGTGTTTGTGAGTSAGTTTGAGAGTSAGAGTGRTCMDDDYAGWVGGGPGCLGGAGGTGGGAATGGATGIDAPNAETSAIYLGEIEDDDDCGGVVTGVINGNTDIDWYTYHGTDHLGALVDPARDRGQDRDLQLCAYVACDNGEEHPGVSCDNAQPQQSGQGLHGCCTDGNALSFDISFCCTFQCLGSEDADLYFSVAGPTLAADACVDYEILFHY